jgi:hypothetical protein
MGAAVNNETRRPNPKKEDYEMEKMKVAPNHSCVGCYRGDTNTGLVLTGPAEFHTASLHTLAGIPMDEAQATVLVAAEQEQGCDPGKVPADPYQSAIRLCRECADRTGAKIGKLDDDLPHYDYACMFPEGV